MKRILISIFSLLLIFEVKSQSKIYLRSGDIVNTAPEKNPSIDANFFSECIFDNHYYLWLQFATFPTDDVKYNLQKTGVVLYDYLPDNTFITSFPINYNFNQLQQYSVYAICKPKAAYKIDASLFTPNSIPWAVENNNLKVEVSYTNCVLKSDFINALNAASAQFTVINNNNFNGVISLSATIDDIQKIATNPLVQYIEPIGAPAAIEDFQAISNHRINTVQTSDNWSNGKKLDGSGVVVGLGDGEMPELHIDFTGRILSNSSAAWVSGFAHSEHCAGIIAGAGNLNPTVKGQARGANLKVYNYYEPYGLFPSIYQSDSVRIISHSLGQTCNTGYDANARVSDTLIRFYPSLMYVHSAGNSGQTSCGGLFAYKTITGGYKAGKNVITVGNLTKADVIDPSSSRGPLPDGRIKPEICAVGNNVNSTQPNNTFSVASGTSMACPAIAGNLAVLYQAYKNKNGTEPEGSLIKAIAMNTADDLGNDGPDFTYGYGRINVRKAVNIIENANYFSNTITTGSTNTHTIAIPSNVATAKIMVYWADKAATAGAAKSLVNNIDAKLIAANNTEFLPWVIDLSAGQDATTCDAPAIKGIDSVNNMEQVQLDNPVAGNYTLNIFGKKIPSGPQKYFVTYEFTYTDEIVVTHPIGGETFAPSETQRIRWDAAPGISTFGIQYSLNNGTTWLTVASSVAADSRYYDWTVPASATTAKALIKVSRGTASDVSDTNFVILKAPTNIVFLDVCKTSTKISWTAVSNATSYDVFRLGEKYMELVGTTTTNNLVLENQDNGVLFYYAVRAKLGSKNANGRLTNAVSHTNTSTVVCPLAVKLISFNASLKNNTVNLVWKVAGEENMLNYIVEKSTTPNFEKIEIVGQLKPTNTSFEHQYQLTDNNLKANTTFYYRLKMVETGKILYSSVQAIKIDKWVNESFVISPNPANSFIGIIVNNINNNNSNLIVNIYNEIGLLLATKTINNASIGSKYEMPTTSLASGNYFVNIVDATTKALLYKQQVAVVK